MPPRLQLFAIGLNRFLALAFVLCACAMWVDPAFSQVDANTCGPIRNHYGPYDYRTQRDKLQIVEDHHFTPEVEALIRGKDGYLVRDIAYTLHTSPNHHRALMSLARLAERLKTPQPERLSRPVECYFERAIRFTPDDTVVRILYAQFLTKNNRSNEALQQLEVAITYAKDSAFSHYNIGLAYFDMGQFDKALTQAHKAAELGMERTELADMLKGANKWQEPIKSP